MNRKAAAFSPCSITGFFRIDDRFEDPLRVGSIGATVALRNGVTTRVVVKTARKTRVLAKFNRKPLPANSVSYHVAKHFLDDCEKPVHAEITHHCELPVGCGYGTSGAGALSLSFALNEAMGLSMSLMEAAQIAHASEVARRTGLGTVSSAFTGGLAIRTVPGAPGIGRVQRFLPPASARLLTASFGPISTRRLLQNAPFKTQVNTCADRLLARLEQRVSLGGFLSLSQGFTNCLGLASKRLSRLISRFEMMGMVASMAMLGETIFTVIQKDSLSGAKKAVQIEGLRPRVCEIARTGARLL